MGTEGIRQCPPRSSLGGASAVRLRGAQEFRQPAVSALSAARRSVRAGDRWRCRRPQTLREGLAEIKGWELPLGCLTAGPAVPCIDQRAS